MLRKLLNDTQIAGINSLITFSINSSLVIFIPYMFFCFVKNHEISGYYGFFSFLILGIVSFYISYTAERNMGFLSRLENMIPTHEHDAKSGISILACLFVSIGVYLGIGVFYILIT